MFTIPEWDESTCMYVVLGLQYLEWDESTRMYVVLGLQYLSEMNLQGCMLF